jgi:hypothetical protein
MKHLNKIFVAVMVMGLSSHTQDSNNHGQSLWVNAIDTRTSAGGGNGWLDQHFSQPFAVKTIGMFFHLYLTSVYLKYLGDNSLLEFKVRKQNW